MSKVKSYSKYSSILLANGFEWFCYLFVVGLFFSRFLLSASAVMLLITSVFSYAQQRKKIVPRIEHILFPFIFLVFLLSYFNSSDIVTWKTIIFRNSILIMLPLSFTLAKRFPIHKINYLLLSFALLNFLCLITSAFKSLLNYDGFLLAISNSKNIQPIIGPNHSELSVLSVVSFCILCYLISTSASKRNRILLLLTLFVFFLSLHIIAYRFSLITIYILGVSYLIYLIFLTRKWIYMAIFAVLISGLIITFTTMPSVKLRYKNTVQDIQSIIENKNPNYQSLGQRWMAIKCASGIIKEHPLLGVSPADAGFEMNVEYTRGPYLLIPENRIFVHNQFIFYALAFGIPFLVLFLILMGISLYKINRISTFYLFLLIPFIFHMMIENTLEKQITTYAFIFLWLLPFSIQSEKINK